MTEILSMGMMPIGPIVRFYRDAQTIYSAHSPFVYDFMKRVMNSSQPTEQLISIERERNALLVSKSVISFQEYGAGSAMGENHQERKVSEIARNSLSSKWQCRILHAIIRHYKVSTILELGTSLGISSAYLASANLNSTLFTLEGNPTSLEIAQEIWRSLGITNIQSKLGEFNSTLPEVLLSSQNFGMVFLDGNHKKSATIQYYKMVKPKLNTSSIVVVDDIYWSKGMNEAWEELKQDDAVAFSIDLFRMGILFFDQEIMRKQHFKLIQYLYKPWSIGLFG